MVQILDLNQPKDLDQFLEILKELGIQYTQDINKREIRIYGKPDFIDLDDPKMITIFQSDIKISVVEYLEHFNILILKPEKADEIITFKNIKIRYKYPDLIIRY